MRFWRNTIQILKDGIICNYKMASLREIEKFRIKGIFCKKDFPLRYNAEDIEYSNVIKNIEKRSLQYDDSSLEEKLSIKMH